MVGQNVIYGCPNITSIIWQSNAKIPHVGYDVDPNCLLYIPSGDINTAECGLQNIIVDGKAQKIVLTDQYPYHCPKEFTAGEVIYKHQFTKITVPNTSRGWYTLYLPFDVKTITYNDVPLSPFGNDDDNLHFWLRSLTSDGYKNELTMEKQKPYIIAMPYNTEYYDSQYNIYGEVTFSAKNKAGIPFSVTAEPVPVEGPDYSLIGTYTSIPAKISAYPINDEGSAFVASLRETKPFEVYAINNSLGTQTRSFTLDNSARTRTYHPVGRKPSITDM